MTHSSVSAPCAHPLSVLVACEFSGTVRDAFIAAGHQAISCDLLPTESPGPHYQGDVRDLLSEPFDLMIAHPPCTHLSISGARWFKDKRQEQAEALDFVRLLMNAPIPMIAVENPVSVISTHIRKPDQIIHPWQFGHGETKKTCLWLKGLPPLKATAIVAGREPRIHFAQPGPNRWKERSKTYPGIAAAMATQWGRGDMVADALRLSRQIPNHPHPDRARAVHEWAVEMRKIIKGGYSR